MLHSLQNSSESYHDLLEFFEKKYGKQNGIAHESDHDER